MTMKHWVGFIGLCFQNSELLTIWRWLAIVVGIGLGRIFVMLQETKLRNWSYLENLHKHKSLHKHYIHVLIYMSSYMSNIFIGSFLYSTIMLSV